MVEIKLSKDNSEIVPYNFPSFPVHARKYWISYYPSMTAVSHWHADLEFIVILKGSMLYSVNGEDYLLKEGQSIFVNSGYLHFGHSDKGTDCQFLCILFHPSLLYVTEDIKEFYTETICQNSALPFHILDSSTNWQYETISQLKQIFNICQEKFPGFELSILSHFYSLWLTIFQNIESIKMKNEPLYDRKLEALYRMIGYIQTHYTEKLTLNHIALSGNVCRSRCCDIFSSILHMTPIQYLTHFRLEKSIEALNHSNLSITEIALLCGFNSSSYFAEIFHREMKCTPSQYKEKISEK